MLWASHRLFASPQVVFHLKQSKMWQVSPGSNAYQQLNLLVKQGLISSYNAFWQRWYLRMFSLAKPLQAGWYQIEPGTSLNAFWQTLQAGNIATLSVRLPEGQPLWQILDQWQAHSGFDVDVAFIPSKMKYQGITFEPAVEGYFYPDTYQVPYGSSASELLQRAHNRLTHYLSANWSQRIQDLPLQTPYQALILASIVEKETAHDDERRQIAGVFINRLRRGMKLQTDPTIIYGLGPKFDGDIRRQDLRAETPYNTYFIKGLPPTPICAPSIASIQAVLNPQATSALFFVADGRGRHRFSNTYAEHQQAVKEYLRITNE